MCVQCGLSRRALLGASLATLAIGGGARAAVGPGAPNAIPPNDPLGRLVAGNARYCANTATNRDDSVGRAARADAQYPIAAIVACADSRVAPEVIFDQGLGDVFVERVAGGL